MIEILQTVIAFILALGILVTFHEFGHYWVAHKLGVKILRFSVGFGRPLWLRRHGADNTEFVLAAVPLGGFVKMLDEREGEVAASELGRAFNRQSLAVRAAIVVAGPLANFLLAFIVYTLSYLAGVSGPRPILGTVDAHGLAHQAGLRQGDEIIAVNGAPTAIWDNVLNRAVTAILDQHSLDLRVRTVTATERDVRLDFAGLSVDDLTRGEFFAKLGLQPLRPKIPPRLGKVLPGEAAAAAGLRADDLIVAVDGVAVDDWLTWVDRVRASPGRALAVTVKRNGHDEAMSVTPHGSSDDGKLVGRIGAEVAPPPATAAVPTAIERYDIVSAAAHGADRTLDVALTTLKFLRQIVVGQASLDNLSGPLSIAQFAGESAKLGASRFLEFLGLVSVSLGVLNLLPIPLLDGGHLVYYLIESIIRRPVPDVVQSYGQQIGLVLLLSLMGLALYNDLMRIF